MKTEDDEDTRDFKKLFLWFIGVALAVSAISWVATQSTHAAKGAVLSYEEFHEIHETCQKINSDLAAIRELPSDDPMFEQFSKSSMVTTKKQQLSRWVNEYNAKSATITRGTWKSPSLPQRLNVADFPSYSEN